MGLSDFLILVVVLKAFLEEVVGCALKSVTDGCSALYCTIFAILKKLCKLGELFCTCKKEVIFLSVPFKEHNDTAVVYFKVFDVCGKNACENCV